MGEISVPRPAIGDNILVYHENRGSVFMEVVSINSNLIECEFEGIEICVRLDKVFDGESWKPRWMSIN